MKCVCEKRGQWRNEAGKIVSYGKGDVDIFEKCPPFARPIAGEVGASAPPTDFETALEEELLEAEYDLDALRDYIKNKYDRKPGTRGKEKLVAMLLDCRYRDMGDVDLNQVI